MVTFLIFMGCGFILFLLLQDWLAAKNSDPHRYFASTLTAVQLKRIILWYVPIFVLLLGVAIGLDFLLWGWEDKSMTDLFSHFSMGG